MDNTYIAVMTNVPATEYRSERSLNDTPLPFMRALKTAKFKGTPTCPILEQPNFVSGLPAQSKFL